MTHVELIERSIRRTDFALRHDRELIDTSKTVIEESRQVIADADVLLMLYETAIRPLAFAHAMTPAVRPS